MSIDSELGIPYVGDHAEYDIFVSYAHGRKPDDGSDSSLKLWTNNLIANIPEHIGYSLSHTSHEVSIFYDDALAGNSPITETLKRSVEASSILLVIMTRDYLNSEWCTKERDWFKSEIERRGGGIENVFVVRAMATDGDDWPDFLTDEFGETVLGFPFCNEQKQQDARPFGWVTPNPSDELYNKSLTRLVSGLAKKLDQIREENTLTEKNIEVFIGKPSHETCRVFVAPGTEDVQPFLSEVRSNLVEQGCIISPKRELLITNINAVSYTHLTLPTILLV